jgi:hypothetical protein
MHLRLDYVKSEYTYRCIVFNFCYTYASVGSFGTSFATVQQKLNTIHLPVYLLHSLNLYASVSTFGASLATRLRKCNNSLT